MGNGISALVRKGVPLLASLVGLGALFLWTSIWFQPTEVAERSLETGKPADPPSASPPSGSPAPETLSNSATPPSGVPQPSSGPQAAPVAVVAMPGEWPGFRGARRDNVAPLDTKVPAGTEGFRLAWKVSLGEGYAAPAIKNGRVYVLDYDASNRQDVLRCFALADGKEVWRNAYPSDTKRNHGISRTIPATDGKVVVSLGPKGTVLCADAVTGQTKWMVDLVKEYGTQIPDWYAGQCPLIQDGKVILAPAGKVLMVALDLTTGKPAWSTPNSEGWTMTHSSITPMYIGAYLQYVYCGSGGVAGVSAKDGTLLWQSDAWKVDTATVPSPVPLGDGKLFLSGGYNAGSMILQVEQTDAGWSAKTLSKIEPEVFGSDQQTPILYQGFLYGVAPNGEMVCLSTGGRRVWGSGTSARFGLGPYLIADQKILALNDRGTLTIAEASPKGFKPLGKVQILQGRESWGPMAIAGDRLIARDFESMVCIQLGGA